MFLERGAHVEPVSPQSSQALFGAAGAKAGKKGGFAALLGSLLGGAGKVSGAMGSQADPASGAGPQGRLAQSAKDQALLGREKAASHLDKQDQGRLKGAADDAVRAGKTQDARQASLRAQTGRDQEARQDGLRQGALLADKSRADQVKLDASRLDARAQAAKAEAESAAAALRDAKVEGRKKGRELDADAQSLAASAAAPGARAERRQRTEVASAESAEGDLRVKDRRKEKTGEGRYGLVDLRSEADRAQAVQDQGPKRVEGSAEAAPKGAEGRETLFQSLSSAAPSGVESARGTGQSSFAQMLSRQLQDGLGQEIVKQAVVVLQGADKGTIRLQLRPESLGSVRVQISMEDATLSGKITVESDAAKEAFERSLPHLAQAFEAAGFESPKLEISVNSQASHSENQGRKGGAEGPYWSERLLGGGSDAAFGADDRGAGGKNPWGRRLDVVM